MSKVKGKLFLEGASNKTKERVRELFEMFISTEEGDKADIVFEKDEDELNQGLDKFDKYKKLLLIKNKKKDISKDKVKNFLDV